MKAVNDPVIRAQYRQYLRRSGIINDPQKITDAAYDEMQDLVWIGEDPMRLMRLEVLSEEMERLLHNGPGEMPADGEGSPGRRPE